MTKLRNAPLFLLLVVGLTPIAFAEPIATEHASNNVRTSDQSQKPTFLVDFIGAGFLGRWTTEKYTLKFATPQTVSEKTFERFYKTAPPIFNFRATFDRMSLDLSINADSNIGSDAGSVAASYAIAPNASLGLFALIDATSSSTTSVNTTDIVFGPYFRFFFPLGQKFYFENHLLVGLDTLAVHLKSPPGDFYGTGVLLKESAALYLRLNDALHYFFSVGGAFAYASASGTVNPGNVGIDATLFLRTFTLIPVGIRLNF